MIKRRHHGDIGRYISYLLLCVGLWAEYNAISAILIEKDLIKPGFITYVVHIVIAVMLIHHFFIIKNFHDLDHMSERDVIRTGFGYWVLESISEHTIRFLLFGLFAILTGEIIYLALVMQKNSDLANHIYFYNNPITHEVLPKQYDISWITKWYLISALALSFLMLTWDIVGWAYDTTWKPLNPLTKGQQRKNGISPFFSIFKSNNPYLTFVLCDGLALVLWILFNCIYFNVFLDAATLSVILFALAYVFLIFARVVNLVTRFPRYARIKLYLFNRKSFKAHFRTFLSRL